MTVASTAFYHNLPFLSNLVAVTFSSPNLPFLSNLVAVTFSLPLFPSPLPLFPSLRDPSIFSSQSAREHGAAPWDDRRNGSSFGRVNRQPPAISRGSVLLHSGCQRSLDQDRPDRGRSCRTSFARARTSCPSCPASSRRMWWCSSSHGACKHAPYLAATAFIATSVGNELMC